MPPRRVQTTFVDRADAERMIREASTFVSEVKRAPTHVDSKAPKVCCRCSSRKTPLWRTGPIDANGKATTLCNRCGALWILYRRSSINARAYLEQ